MKAIIFCVETNKHANTDWVYIKSTLDKLHVIVREVYGINLVRIIF